MIWKYIQHFVFPKMSWQIMLMIVRIRMNSDHVNVKDHSTRAIRPHWIWNNNALSISPASTIVYSRSRDARTSSLWPSFWAVVFHLQLYTRKWCSQDVVHWLWCRKNGDKFFKYDLYITSSWWKWVRHLWDMIYLNIEASLKVRNSQYLK